MLKWIFLFGFGASFAVADDYEQCYCISRVGLNDGWLDNINPGKYESEVDFDCRAWRFVAKGSCEERGGSLTACDSSGDGRLDPCETRGNP